MKKIIFAVCFLAMTSTAFAGGRFNYKGDDICKPPEDFEAAGYSKPYNAEDHPNDPPMSSDADIKGWFCSHTREDGTSVSFGTSMTPNEQWIDFWLL